MDRWCSASGGLVVLFGYGVIWLSVRHQRPYDGPTGPAIAMTGAGMSHRSLQHEHTDGLAFWIKAAVQFWLNRT
jgi:hypothetical protein